MKAKKITLFFYFAHNARPLSLVGIPKDVMKYRGKYRGGWKKLRETRFKKMKELKVFPSDMSLSKPEKDVRNLSKLDKKTKNRMDLVMATYAAMIDRVDLQLRRLIEKLENEKILENTLIVFLSDNGACTFDRTKKKKLWRTTICHGMNRHSRVTPKNRPMPVIFLSV